MRLPIGGKRPLNWGEKPPVKGVTPPASGDTPPTEDCLVLHNA